MRHFAYLADEERERLFHVPPQSFTRADDPALLSTALGASLYSPGTRPSLAGDLLRRAADGVVSAVVCLEDAVPDEQVAEAERNVVRQLSELAATGADGPLVFVRVRSPEQIADVVSGLGQHVAVLSGFVLPKFTARTGRAFLRAVQEASRATGHRLFAMPVLESPELIHRETRVEALIDAKRLLDAHRDQVLAVRLGTTDLSSAYGIRRDRDLTIYDVGVVAEAIADVVNVFGRADGSGYVVTGPVWEYFADHERIFKPLLRQSPFAAQDAMDLREQLITQHVDGLIRELVLDKANGLLGKTVIHPSHVPVVHALSVVTHEEFVDATDVLGAERAGGGVAASSYRNKMNEAKPHRAWAQRTLRRAQAFGVAAEGIRLVDLLAAGVE
ncbi:MAG TPA: HpcH/HpaI aldolase/citrate lyase family protein [Actinomycetales bacterium]|nr:HpcH/HpaI aldolase/citrate lyase family protein [Actinomycetales bacterium]